MVEESKSSNRNLVIVLALGALLLALVAGILIVALVLGGDDSGEEAAMAESAKFMPDDTQMFATFNPHLDQAKNFEVIQKAWGDNPLVSTGLAEMLGSMKEGGLDYEADIAPWLGSEISFGMMGDIAGIMFQGVEMSFSGIVGEAPQVDEMPVTPQFTVSIATEDSAASDKFLDKLRAEAGEGGTVWKETEYKGVKIVHSESETAFDTAMAYATVDDFVVLAVGGLEAMQASIDARDGTNLTGNQRFKDVMAKLPGDQLGYGYVDAGAYMDALLKVAGSELADIPLDLFNPEQVEAIKGAGFSIGFEPDGLRVDFVAAYDKEALPEDWPAAEANTNAAAGHVPANALFYLTGSGLGSVVETGLDAAKAMPDVPPDLDEQLQMMTALLGVSVDDLVDMLSGEFALAITHDPAGIAGDPEAPVGMSFLLEAKEIDVFQRLINSVTTLLAFGGEMDLPKESVGDVDVTMFSDPVGDNMIVGWGVGKGYFAIATSKELLEAAFGDSANLADAATFKAAVEPLPERNTGLFYMNLGGLLEIVGDAMGPEERESVDEARSLWDPIKTISAALESFDKGKDSVSGTFFVLIESE